MQTRLQKRREAQLQAVPSLNKVMKSATVITVLSVGINSESQKLTAAEDTFAVSSSFNAVQTTSRVPRCPSKRKCSSDVWDVREARPLKVSRTRTRRAVGAQGQTRIGKRKCSQQEDEYATPGKRRRLAAHPAVKEEVTSQPRSSFLVLQP